MDPLMQAQAHIRHNADDLQNFLRDLNQWKSDMTKKEKEVGQLGPVEQKLPAVRGSKGGKSKIEVISKNKKNKTKDNDILIKEEPKPKRIASYDYKAWEKFDADKACDDIDNKAEKKDSEDDISDEEEDIEAIRRKEEAVQEKEKGNDFFRLGKIDSAIECYTNGMLCDPSNAFLPANRALALLKKEMYGAAEQDCDLALNIDKNYIKAYQRRGIARMALKKLDLAKQDFRKVLELEPGNKQAYDELTKIKKIEEMEKKIEKQQNNSENINLKIDTSTPKKISIEEIDSEKAGLLKPITKPPHLRSKKPMKRMKIQELVTKIKIQENQTNIKQEVKNDIINLDVKFETELLKSEEIIVPNSPQNLYQFQTSWKILKKHKDKLYLYLKQIPCDQYVTIFDDFLEAEVISDFLFVMEQFYVEDNVDIYAPLLSLTNVKRFKILAMFFSDSDKKRLQKLFSYLVTCSDKSRNDIVHLANLYQMSI